MGINDGLVSTASLMMGVGAGADSLRAMQVLLLLPLSLLINILSFSMVASSQAAGQLAPQLNHAYHC